MITVGEAVGYLTLDTTGYDRSLVQAQSSLSTFTSGSNGAATALSKVGDSATKLGKSMSLSVTAPVVLAGASIVKTSMDFESGLSKVAAISGATGDQMDQLKRKAVEMGAKTTFSASESADAFSFMASAGWTTNEMLDGIQGVMTLASASGESLAATSDICTNSMTAFGMKANETQRFVDVLAMTANATNSSVADLGESFRYVAPVAGAMGYSVEDVSVALGIMANNGIKASSAGTSLRGLLTNLVKPTDDMVNIMDKLGIKVTDSTGNMKPLNQLLTEMRGSFGGLTNEQKASYAATLAGKEGMSGLLAIMNTSDADFKNLTEQIGNSTGAAQQMSDVMNDNLNGQLTALEGSIETVALQFGDILLPVLKKIVDKLSEFANWLGTLSASQQEIIVVIAGVAAAIGPILIILGTLLSSIGSIITSFSAVSGFISTTLIPALSGVAAPVIAIIAVIGALAAGMAYVYNTNKSVRESFKTVVALIIDSVQPALEFITNTVLPNLKSGWQTLLDILKPIGDFLVGVFTSCWQDLIIPILNRLATEVIPVLTETFQNLWNNILVPFGEFMVTILAPRIQVLADILSFLWQNVTEPLVSFLINYFIDSFVQTAAVINDTVIPAVSKVMTAFQWLWDNVLNPISSWLVSTFAPVFQNVFTLIGTLIESCKKYFSGLIDFIAGVFTGNWQLAWEGIKQIISAMWDGIVAIVKTAIENTKTIIFSILTAIKDNIITPILNGIKAFFISIFESIKTTISEKLTAIKETFSTIWTTVKDTTNTVFNTIKNIISVVILLIVEIVKAAFNLITIPFRFIWENCKDTIFEVWNKIKSTVTDALNSVKTSIETVFNAVKNNVITPIWTSIKDKLQSVWDSIKSTVTNAVNSIKTTIENVFNAIKDNIVTPIWTSIKNIISGVWNNIKSTISNAVDNVKSRVETVFTGVRDTITNIFNSVYSNVSNIFNNVYSKVSSVIDNLWSTVTSVFNGISNSVSSPLNGAYTSVANIFNNIRNTIANTINNARDIVHNAIESIKNKFNFNWSLPSLKLPHFNIEGGFSLDPPSVPSFGIDWYAKGGVFSSPSLIGVGEAGTEAVVPLENNLGWVKNLVAELVTRISQAFDFSIANTIRDSLLDIQYEISKMSTISRSSGYNLSEVMATETRTSGYKTDPKDTTQSRYPKEGDIFNFYSPKALSEIECAKQFKKTKKELTENL